MTESPECIYLLCRLPFLQNSGSALHGKSLASAILLSKGVPNSMLRILHIPQLYCVVTQYSVLVTMLLAIKTQSTLGAGAGQQQDRNKQVPKSITRNSISTKHSKS